MCKEGLSSSFQPVSALVSRQGQTSPAHPEHEERASSRHSSVFIILFCGTLGVLCCDVLLCCVSHWAVLLVYASLLSAALPITNATDISIVFDVELGDI